MKNEPLKALEVLQYTYKPDLIEAMRSSAEAPTPDELTEHPLQPPFPAGYSY